MTDTEKKIAEIREALEKATPGTWYAQRSGDSDWRIGAKNINRHPVEIAIISTSLLGMRLDDGREKENAHLIANAPEWLRFLLSEYERSEEFRSWAYENIDRLQTELDQKDEENRKLRQERDTIYADWNKEKDKQIQLTYELLTAQQEIDRLREHVSRAWKACWKVAGDDTKLEQKLIECLQWYADTQNYKYPTVGGAGAKRPIDYDRGERARDILREIGVTVDA